MKIASGTGRRTNVLPRSNGGIVIAQGPHHVLLSAEEWTQVRSVADAMAAEHGRAAISR